MLNFYLQRTGQAPIEPASQPTKQTPSNDSIPQAQKAAFASANKLRERLEQEGIPQTVLWSYVKRRYGVESRNDMMERQWTELAAELQSASSTQQLFNDFVKRVKQMMAAAKDSEVPSEGTEVIDAEVIKEEKLSSAPDRKSTRLNPVTL